MAKRPVPALPACPVTLGDSGGDPAVAVIPSDCQLLSAPGWLGRTASAHEQEVRESLRFSRLHKAGAGPVARAAAT